MEHIEFSKSSGTQDVVVLAVAIALVAAWYIAYICLIGLICI